MAFPPPNPAAPSDGNVDTYQRVVNGKVVTVNSYAKKSSTSTNAAKKVRLLPGRPRMVGQPGTYVSGRDIPGVKAAPLPPPPPMFDNESGAPLMHPSGRPMTPEEAKSHQQEQKQKGKPGGGFPGA